MGNELRQFTENRSLLSDYRMKDEGLCSALSQVCAQGPEPHRASQMGAENSRQRWVLPNRSERTGMAKGNGCCKAEGMQSPEFYLLCP